jgi:hypothetical protein
MDPDTPGRMLARAVRSWDARRIPRALARAAG